MSNKREDYRIRQDNDNVFVVEKLVEVSKLKDYIFWYKTVYVMNYKPLNVIGEYKSSVKYYSTLEDARNAINRFIKYPIYHNA